MSAATHPAPALENGQIWTRNKGQKQVRIEALRRFVASFSDPGSFDVYWVTVEKPYRRGAIWESNFRKTYTFNEPNGTTK